MSWIAAETRPEVKRVRAYKVQPGDQLFSPYWDEDAWRFVRARPHVGEYILTISRVRKRWISPVFEFQGGGHGSSYGESSGWGPCDWVELWTAASPERRQK